MNIYFSGIGGVGIGPLAEIAADAGYEVLGSDQASGPIVNRLVARGIEVNIGQDGTFLQAAHAAKPIDRFVYTAALPADHPELVLARQLGIKSVKRDELLSEIIAAKSLKLIAVAGTHGKTTTTGMFVWALQKLGVPVSYSVGTTISFGPSGKFDPDSKYFIYECDEYDRNFLHFQPYLSLITAVDYDHPDTYPTRDDYTAAFRQFIDQSSQLIMWRSDAAYLKAAPQHAWVLPPNDELALELAGEHNRRNATLVIKGLEYLNLGNETSRQAALETFPGTDRRFEKLADNLYSDYGHHPAEIAATLQLARELSDHVVLVYQPHQNVRQHEIQDAYTDIFEPAEAVYWLPTYLSREDPNLPILTPAELSANVTNLETVHFADLNDELWQKIEQASNEGKLVLCMGAGTIDGWLRQKLAA